MALSSRFGKPNMTNIPRDVGERIFRTIISTPPPDWEKMNEQATELERQMLIEREKHRDHK